MDHIFGDSHDIAFGAKSPTPANSATGSSPREATHTRKVHHDDFGDLEAGSRPQEAYRPKPAVHSVREHVSTPRSPRPVRSDAPVREQAPVRVPRPMPAPEPISTPALSRLIDGMKSSFFPREEDVNTLRMVIISPPDVTDPLILITKDDTTVVLGSGFSTTTRAGIEYTTFPDMRLIASEKTRLSAWILQDASIDVSPFQTILPAVGFPPIYATRDIIAKFRNNITDADFLSKCRFFELFADAMTERRIGDIDWRSDTVLMLKSGVTEIGFTHFSVLPPRADKIFLTRTQDTYSLGMDTIQAGEILSFNGSEMKRHTMKFTFDTFFIDKNSVGVAAGYTLGDREQLAENGVLMFTLEEDTRARTIAGHIFIDSRGFVHAHEMMSVHKEVLKGIRITYEKLITENPKIDRGSLAQGLRRELTKYCYLLTGRTPVVMPILIEK